MKSRIRSIIVTVILIFFAFGGGYLLGQSPAAPVQLFGANAAASNPALVPFLETWNLVETRYFEQPVDEELLVEAAISGMLDSLDDPHTRYLSPSDQEAALEAMAGEFQGIGAEVESVDGAITIVAPIDGSPAEAAGLQPGDILRSADGTDLTGMDVSEAAALVRGPAGTAVQLLVERDGESFELEIVRDVIKLPTVRGEILAEGLAYVRLSRFGTNTAEELNVLLTDLMAENPVGLILDLRSNPGGALDTTVEIADEFLDEGVVLYERFGDGRMRPFDATEDGVAQEVPMVVLIDEGSASASEVLAGAIRDSDRGILIGQTSFGKGTVQTWQTLANNGGVRITIAQWLTPGEASINETGLDPDYFISLPEMNGGAEFEDTQLQAAIDFLLGEMIVSEE